MKVINKTIKLQTEETMSFTDVTDQVEKIVVESEIVNGLVNVQSMHTTATIILNENEPLLLEDIKEHLSTLIPEDDEYKHDNFSVRTVNMCDDECANGHAHCKAVHLTPGVTVNLFKGQLQLGRWQRFLFLELDRSRNRKIQIQVMGK